MTVKYFTVNNQNSGKKKQEKEKKKRAFQRVLFSFIAYMVCPFIVKAVHNREE